MLLKLMVFLVRKMVIITPTLKINNLAKLPIILSKLKITFTLSKELIMEKLYHIYMRNLWKPQKVINSIEQLLTSLSQIFLNKPPDILKQSNALLLRRVTFSMFQKVWKKICKNQDFMSTSKRNLLWWTCKNSWKSQNFLKNGKLWSPEELKRNYLRSMFD